MYDLLLTELLPSRCSSFAETRAFTSVTALVQPEIRLCSLVCGEQSTKGSADGMAYQSRLFQVH